ncbi:MAG TPA: acyltransferase [Cytophagaceae bacterium]|nr:acyltransferase [Cytophagaceae bacterium]
MNELPKEKIHFYNLDIIRLLAALTVVVAHAYEGWKGWYGQPLWLQGNTPSEPNQAGITVSTFIANFNLGVDTFFLISGFLITYLLLVEKETQGKINIGKFYLRRALRILPLYYLSILIAPLLVRVTHGEQPNYLINIFFLNNFYAIQTEQWTFPFAHFWSICVEEHFYLFWPWLIAFVPTKKLPALFSFLLLISILFRGYAATTMEYPYYTLYLHTLSRIDVMVIGAIIAYVHFQKPIQLSVPLTVRILVYGFFILILCIEPNNLWGSIFMAMVKKYFYIAVIAFEMINYLFNPKAIFNFKKKNILHYLGKTSYGIYMFGNMLIPFIISGIEQKLTHTFLHNVVLFLCLNVVITCIVATISYELFEKHFLSFKKRFELVKTER